jgi:hypothetical protein
MDHHLIAGLGPRYEFTRLAHNAGNVVAENVRQRDLDARHSAAHEDVEMIQRARFYLDEYFVRANVRVRDVRILEHLRTAVLSKNRGLHEDCSVTSLSAACSRAW